MTEGNLARDVRSILKQVETGGQVIVERDAQPVAVIRPAEPTATIDADFAKDLEAAVAAHR